MGGGRQVGGGGRTDRTGGRDGGRRREVAGVRRGRDEEARQDKAKERSTRKMLRRVIQETLFSHSISQPI